MPHNWIHNSDPRIREKLMHQIGIESIEELFSDIPEKFRLKRDLAVGYGRYLSEYEMYRIAMEFRSKISKPRIPPFAGVEVCYHYVPAIVKEIIRRSEFYTAYTPYQPEINQGILQALFEYQSLMAELYGVDVVNASMYDGSTALAEAIRMALRVTKRKHIVIASSVSPIKRKVITTWLRGLDVRISYIGWNEHGEIDVDRLKDFLSDETAALVVETPNVFGVVERRLEEIAQIVHSKRALLIAFSNPLSLGVIKPPGECGADIVVGEGQPLGLGLYYGGTTLGILGTRRDPELIRQLPGKLVGITLSIQNCELGYALVLQTREQHIRRERATSNITTNSALMAIAVAVYLSWIGGDGLKKLSLSIGARTRYLIERLSSVKGLHAPLFDKAVYFMKVPARFEALDCETVIKRMRERGILCCSHLGRYDGELWNIGLFCVTEVHSRRDIDLLVKELSEVMS